MDSIYRGRGIFVVTGRVRSIDRSIDPDEVTFRSSPWWNRSKSAAPFDEQINVGIAQLSSMGEGRRNTLVHVVELFSEWWFDRSIDPDDARWRLSPPWCNRPKSATPFYELINMGTAQLSPIGESGRQTLLREVELSAPWWQSAWKTSPLWVGFQLMHV
jgi:hypothetical protein